MVSRNIPNAACHSPNGVKRLPACRVPDDPNLAGRYRARLEVSRPRHVKLRHVGEISGAAASRAVFNWHPTHRCSLTRDLPSAVRRPHFAESRARTTTYLVAEAGSCGVSLRPPGYFSKSLLQVYCKLVISPPPFEPNAPQTPYLDGPVRGCLTPRLPVSIESLMNRTEPSAMATFTPPGWRLAGGITR